MSFQPHKDSAVAVVIQHLQANRDVVSLGPVEIGALCKVTPHNVPTLMKRALQEGALKRERVGRSFFYSLGDGMAVDVASTATDEDQELPPFCAALDSVGELFITGGQVVENGGVLINRQNTVKLCEYLLHTCGYLGVVEPSLVGAS